MTDYKPVTRSRFPANVSHILDGSYEENVKVMILRPKRIGLWYFKGFQGGKAIYVYAKTEKDIPK